MHQHDQKTLVSYTSTSDIAQDIGIEFWFVGSGVFFETKLGNLLITLTWCNVSFRNKVIWSQF